MPIVVDVNVILSSLLGEGHSFEVFALNYLFDKFEFVAPEFIFVEFNKHKDEISRRSKFNSDEFNYVLDLIKEQISIIPSSEFNKFIPEAEKILEKHKKDVQYLALALKLDCNIFSGDKILKKLLPDKVIIPREMLEKFYIN
ncbi:hypothetical protein HYV49_06050 [Candidatus Pacearchaeota archaeon]|nr:hypothetical protein [Candidatus Pacearchaeota archaeon]